MSSYELTSVVIHAFGIVIVALMFLIALAFLANEYNQAKQKVEEERNQKEQNDIN
jgi:hypothetical protein